MSFLDSVFDTFTNRSALAEINRKLDKIMASNEQFESALGRIDTATTAVAALIRKFIEDQAAGGMTADQEAAALARLEGAAAALEAMAASPTDPVPVEVPQG